MLGTVEGPQAPPGGVSDNLRPDRLSLAEDDRVGVLDGFLWQHCRMDAAEDAVAKCVASGRGERMAASSAVVGWMV